MCQRKRKGSPEKGNPHYHGKKPIPKIAEKEQGLGGRGEKAHQKKERSPSFLNRGMGRT